MKLLLLIPLIGFSSPAIPADFNCIENADHTITCEAMRDINNDGTADQICYITIDRNGEKIYEVCQPR